jgi:hypothetical protein
VLFGECEKVVVGVPAQGSVGHIHESEKRCGNSGTLSRQPRRVAIPWAAHLDRFGGESRDQVETPVRGRMHSPTTNASCTRCHVVEHRANMVMGAAKFSHHSGLK